MVVDLIFHLMDDIAFLEEKKYVLDIYVQESTSHMHTHILVKYLCNIWLKW